MQADNLFCLCCLLILICYVTEHCRFNYFENKTIIYKKNKKSINYKIKSINSFFKKFRKKKYSLIIPKTNNNVPITQKQKKYFNNFINLVINNLVIKLKGFLNDHFNKTNTINFIIKNYNNIYHLSYFFVLESKNHILNIELIIIYISKNEYYIISMDLVDIKNKKNSSKFRKAKYYNKWIIN